MQEGSVFEYFCVIFETYEFGVRHRSEFAEAQINADGKWCQNPTIKAARVGSVNNAHHLRMLFPTMDTMPYPFLKKRVAENIDKELLKSMVCAIRYVICIAQTMMWKGRKKVPFY